MATADYRFHPLVSVIIPTRNRPELVCRAVRSALQQTYSNLEVVTVVDGPDPLTILALESLGEPRLRIIALDENVRGGEARNVGVRNARAEWVAFLDDDDEWLPEKIEKHVSLLPHVDPGTNFMASRRKGRGGLSDSKLLPYNFPRSDENWSEYIYCRDESVPTSTYFVAKKLMRDFPFTKGLPFNQDIDWFLRVRAADAIVPVWLPEALTIYHGETDRPHISEGSNWEFPYQWALENKNFLLTKKAFSYVLLIACAPRVKRSASPVRNAFFLFWKAMTLGEINPRFCVLFFAYSLFGKGIKHQLRNARRQSYQRIITTLGRKNA